MLAHIKPFAAFKPLPLGGICLPIFIEQRVYALYPCFVLFHVVYLLLLVLLYYWFMKLFCGLALLNGSYARRFGSSFILLLFGRDIRPYLSASGA